MKTLIIENGAIANITAGETNSTPPEGTEYRAVADDVAVDIGWVVAGDVYTNPNPPPLPPTPEPVPEWEAFNIAFLADPNWQVISAQLPPQILMGVAASAATANAPALQSAYNIAKGAMASVGQTIPDAALESWQAIADTHHIPITF